MKHYAWKPISALEDPEAHAHPELRSLAVLWTEQRTRLRKTGADQRFMERLIRRWSIETGIIELLYDLSEGATQLLVQQGFDAALISHGDTDIAPDTLIRVLEDHRGAIDFAMDVVGGTRPLSVGWIKELHALLTRHQATTRAMLPKGRMIDVPLLRGEFKEQPNNPRDHRSGTTHEYCPPEHVRAEMDKLVEIYRAMPPEIPEVRAAWLHHGFAQIHPFQDGNGRVARVLASIDFLRAGLFPLLVLRTEKSEYIDALRTADDGDVRPLVAFFTDAQKRMLMRGFSEAEQAVTNVSSLDTVLVAAREKLRARQEVAQKSRRVIVERLDHFASVAEGLLEARARDISRTMPSVKTKVLRSKQETHHWYNKQLIQVAQRHDYWADMHEARRWARLELRNGGRTELVVALHCVGNPASGAAVAVAFVDHREEAETPAETPAERPPIDTAAEPLLLAPTEDAGLQEKRFTDWLERAVVQGLAIWVRFL
ncbi:MAG: Fic family protein [Myxococcota bacterium]